MKDILGIVLKERDYGETSKILDVFTKEFGVIGVIAKGSKKIKSNISFAANKLTYGIFHIYYKDGKLSTLTNVDVISPFMNLRGDINALSCSMYLLELTSQVVKQTHEYESIFNLLIASLTKINNKLDPLVITNIYELKLLSYLGVSPILNKCSCCDSTEVITLSSSMHGLLCKNCRTYEKIVSKEVIKTIRMYYYLDISKISKIDIKNEVKNTIDDFLTDYYNNNTGIYLTAKTFINDLKKINVYT